jgi:hypothetical protein
MFSCYVVRRKRLKKDASRAVDKSLQAFSLGHFAREHSAKIFRRCFMVLCTPGAAGWQSLGLQYRTRWQVRADKLFRQILSFTAPAPAGHCHIRSTHRLVARRLRDGCRKFSSLGSGSLTQSVLSPVTLKFKRRPVVGRLPALLPAHLELCSA